MNTVQITVFCGAYSGVERRKPEHLPVRAFFFGTAIELLRSFLTWRQVRAAAVRHFRSHADAFAQRGVGVDGFADVYSIGAHSNVKKVLYKVH